jgi:subtilisin
MPKYADNGPSTGSGTTSDTGQPASENGAGERRSTSRSAAASAAAGNTASTLNPASAPEPDAEAGATRPPGGRALGERKKQFVIAPRALEVLSPMGLSPLSLSSVEQALRASADIDIIDTVGPKSTVGMMGDGFGAAQGTLVARMTEQKAATLYQQGQGRLVVERDQYLGMMESPLQPSFVSGSLLHAGPAFNTSIIVLGKDGQPVADAEVSLFGSMLPATGITDAQGQATISLYGETAASIRSIYVKPKADYWSFYQRDPDLATDEPNVVALKALSDWPSLAGLPGQKVTGWGQKAMRLDQLPPSYRGQGIRIAVIDSGIANGHDGLGQVRAGFDIVNKRTSPDTWNDDALGHGSHCAGVICGADQAFGIRGFAPDAEVHACKLFPGGQVSQLIDALEYCIEKQIDVVNLSLGGAEPSEALEQQIQRARRMGIACIVAAGNSGGPVQYPASSPGVLAVAAIGKLNEFPPDSYHAQTLTQNVDANGYFSASFSCYGPQIGVCGPGVAIASTVPPNNYAAWDGTSMAAPHVTGLAALVLAHHPDFQGMYKLRNAERVERLFQVIKASAYRVSLGEQARIGFGMPDALLALGLQPAAQAPGMGALMAQGLGLDGGLGGAIGGFMAPQRPMFPIGSQISFPNGPIGFRIGGVQFGPPSLGSRIAY